MPAATLSHSGSSQQRHPPRSSKLWRLSLLAATLIQSGSRHSRPLQSHMVFAASSDSCHILLESGGCRCWVPLWFKVAAGTVSVHFSCRFVPLPTAKVRRPRTAIASRRSHVGKCARRRREGPRRPALPGSVWPLPRGISGRPTGEASEPRNNFVWMASGTQSKNATERTVPRHPVRSSI